MTKDREARAAELYRGNMPVAEIIKTLGMGRNKFYELIAAIGIPKRKGRKPQQAPLADPRRHERRDCLHYYPDGGCLDQAAQKDAKFIPCQTCHFWEWADNSAHNGDSELWREVYLMKRGG